MILLIDEKETDKYKACLTPEVIQRLRDKTETGIAFVDDEGQPKGALTISSVEGMEGQYGKNAVIEYFFVPPKYRRQGVFREMISLRIPLCTN
ncbi:MAG: GNAT family N-acetyltransferase [Lachnospiraceae bacterium]|nr:GNAT family N-acetyltransferase [Lachnospiraceae bacterium]